MQTRNFFSKCIIISLLTCSFLMVQPLIENPDIQSVAWAGNQGWSDAFGNSQGRTPPAAGRSDDSTGWDTENNDRNHSQGFYGQQSPQGNQPENSNLNQGEDNRNHSQMYDKSAKANSKSVSAVDSSATAEALLALFNLPVIIANTSEQSIELLINQSPEAAAYADIFREFGKRYLIWDNLKEPMIKRYTETFNRQELQQLKTFFSSATGKKYIQQSDKLMQEMTEDIKKIIFSYHEDLKRMIVEKELAQFETQN